MKNDFYTRVAEVLTEKGWEEIPNFYGIGHLRYGDLEEIKEIDFKTIRQLYEFLIENTFWTSTKILKQGKMFHKEKIGFKLYENETIEEAITIMKHNKGYKIRFRRIEYKYLPSFKTCMEDLPEQEFVQYLKDRGIVNFQEILSKGLDK